MLKSDMPIVPRSIHHHHTSLTYQLKYPYIRVPLVRSNVTSKKFNAFIKQLSAADSLTQINVDFECVSIQWLWLCVLLLLYVILLLLFLHSCVRLFEFSSVNVRIYELCVHTHFTLSRVKTSPEREN